MKALFCHDTLQYNELMVKSQRKPYTRLLVALIIINFIGIGIGLIISIIFLIPNQFKSQYNERNSAITLPLS
jgi:hypothetical protein